MEVDEEDTDEEDEDDDEVDNNFSRALKKHGLIHEYHLFTERRRVLHSRIR